MVVEENEEDLSQVGDDDISGGLVVLDLCYNCEHEEEMEHRERPSFLEASSLSQSRSRITSL